MHEGLVREGEGWGHSGADPGIFYSGDPNFALERTVELF